MEAPRAGARREDPPLVTGRARYTDDLRPPALLHAAILRCPYGHARVERVDVEPATARRGVVAAFGAAELVDLGGPTGIPMSSHFPGPEVVERPLLVGERARFAGEPVAVTLAEDRYAAHDALAAIDVDYERLPTVTDPRRVAAGDEAGIAEGGSDTVTWSTGDAVAVERAFERADHAVAADLEMPRLVSAPMETRAVLAEYGTGTPTAARAREATAGSNGGDAVTEPGGMDAGAGTGEDGPPELTLTTSTQTPHRDRDRIAETLGLEPSHVRVIAPSVGGGFGPKGPRPYPEEPLVGWCAMHLGRPVTWSATRTEGHRTDHQGRDVHVRGRLAIDDDGRVRGLDVRGVVGIGAYPFRGPSAGIRDKLLTGAYDIRAVHCHLTGALTNVTPLGPYRGAGRPEAIYVVERLMDRAATALGIDPAELRRRNYVGREAFPYETALGYTYDSGDYAGALSEALDLVDYDAFRRRRAAARESGRLIGVGIASFVENTGSSAVEHARVEVHPDGAVSAFCGTADQGQGHATAFAAVVADELGVDPDAVELVEGDTDDLPGGTGTFGSRSVSVGASGLVECARDVVEAARPLAADRLEAAPPDLRYVDGAFHVSGAPERTVPLSTLAADAEQSPPSATGGEPEQSRQILGVERVYEPRGGAYAFGTHVAVVEVEPATGEIEVVRYVAVDDCGVRLNETLVEGQVHGGVAQGLGQALWEAAVYDEAGSLLTGSFQDYAMPRAHTMPELETGATVTPSPVTLHGAKGIGEAGTIAAPPAVVNAVVDALAPLGVHHVDMPLAPETVWRAMDEARE